MTNSLIAFLVAAGAGGWLYNKLMRTSGNNLKSSATLAGIIGIIVFFIVLVILRLIPSN